jgi:hypothetical protein
MFRGRQKFLVLVSASLLFAGTLLAEQPSVTAVLTSSQTVLGRPVQLQIKITGSPSARPPDSIQVDGLDIRYTGQSQNVEVRNLQFSHSFVYIYTITPERTGTFRIPPQRIAAGSNSLLTPALTLNVADYGSRSQQQNARGSQSTGEGKIAFAEMVVTKSSAYVGEMVPAEVRLYFNTRSRIQMTDGPEISGQGFTVQKLTKPTEQLDNVGGQQYDVITYKTAIAAARPGRFEIGPVKAKAIVAVPRQRSSGGSRSPFDIFNMDDPFSDPFFSDPFSGLMERREIELESKAAVLEVKPLPGNAPPDFSGAVGNFSIEMEAKPKTAQVGDPITVTSKISGRGNFDRITAPTLESEQGWHKYPPSSNFKQDDDVGISGSKTFETVLTPNESKASIPSLLFSFFDPVSEKYVTLRTNPVPVKIEGAAMTSKSVGPAAAPAQAAATPKPQSKPEDILYQIKDWPGARQSFEPVYLQRNFWLAQIVPFVALLALVGWKIRQVKLTDREAQRRADLQHEAAELQRKLRRGDAPLQEYYAEAARAVQIKTALAKNVNPNVVDAKSAAAAFKLDEAMRDQLETLFQHKDELRYSGGANGESSISPNEKQQVLELIDNLRV